MVREIDIDRAIDIVHMNLGKQSKHTCTRAVANALQGETNYRKSSGVSDPSHMYDRLRQDGWRDVLTSSYTPKKGDVYTVWGVEEEDMVCIPVYMMEKSGYPMMLIILNKEVKLLGSGIR